ncbi:MAG: hypothetical protein V1936_02510 [Patescibacteria group bacterium]
MAEIHKQDEPTREERLAAWRAAHQEPAIEPGRFRQVRAAWRAAHAQEAGLSDEDVCKDMGIPKNADEKPQLEEDLAQAARSGLRRVLVSRAMEGLDPFSLFGKDGLVRLRQLNKYYTCEIGDPNLRGLVDAPHGGPIDEKTYWQYKKLGISVWDRWTNKLAEAAANHMIPKKTRVFADANRATGQVGESSLVTHEPPINVLQAQRDGIKRFLGMTDNLSPKGEAENPVLYIAAHGKVDTRGADCEIAAKVIDGQTPLDPRLAFWFAEKLQAKLAERNIRNKKGEIATVNVRTYLGPYSGSDAIRQLRYGGGEFGFRGFGENFQALQLEIGQNLRFKLAKNQQVGAILQEILEEFTREFPGAKTFEEKLEPFQEKYEAKFEQDKKEYWAVKKVAFKPGFLPDEIGLPLDACKELGVKRGGFVNVVGIGRLKTVKTLSGPEQKSGKAFILSAEYEGKLSGFLEITKA